MHTYIYIYGKLLPRKLIGNYFYGYTSICKDGSAAIVTIYIPFTWKIKYNAIIIYVRSLVVLCSSGAKPTYR